MHLFHSSFSVLCADVSILSIYSHRNHMRLCSLNVKPIAEGILSLLCYSKEIGHLQSIYLLCTTSILFRTFTQKSIRAPVSIYKRNHVSVWNWIQRFKPKKILQNKRKVSEFIIDEKHYLKLAINICMVMDCCHWTNR